MAGLEVGDIITAMGDMEVASTSDLKYAKKSYSAGDTTNITVYRSGELLELEITFDEEVQDTSTITEDNSADEQWQIPGSSGRYGTNIIPGSSSYYSE